MSNITYVRTMKLTYPSDYTTLEFKKMVAELHKRGLSLRDYWNYDGPKDDEYGFRMVERKYRRYWFILNGARVAHVDSNGALKKIVNQLNDLEGMDADWEREDYTTRQKKWCDVLGAYVWLDDEKFIGRSTRSNRIEYDDGHMSIKIDRNWGGKVELLFTFTWECDSIQKKAEIERVCVDQPLKDMGKVQNIFERVMKLKRFGGFEGEPMIDCHFDAKTESRSECTPDIIAKVRASRT